MFSLTALTELALGKKSGNKYAFTMYATWKKDYQPSSGPGRIKKAS